ncbi:uncharacterized protein LOC129802123 [Phlebotomus papatasi]|uniref:uncharacterized protein LOC129802123 n=1 Tax=Phlebotomus papatasi TaxID=29031 RepID=UPI002483D249|nr:uncharacterized protein LOC129802123 [Phlebotomus papatasi]
MNKNMMKCSFIILLAIHQAFTLSTDKKNEIPNYIRVCNRNLSPEYLNECVRRSILMLKPRLSRGIPQLSLPPFNPLHLPKVSFSQDQGPINLNSTYTNIKIYGLSDFKLQSVKIDLKKNYFQLQMMFPELYMTADYLISGHILMLPLQGQGLSYGNYTEVETTATLHCERIMGKDKKEHFRIQDLSVDFTIGDAEWTFDGDNELCTVMNKFINDNWRLIIGEMRPAIQGAMAKIIGKITGKIFELYSIDKLLPDKPYKAFAAELCIELDDLVRSQIQSKCTVKSNEDSSTNMQFILAVASLVVLLVNGGVLGSDVPQLKEKPDWLLTCPRENPNQDGCFKKMFEGMFKSLAKGLPEVGIEPFEPLKIQNVQISKGMGSLTLAGGFQNLLVRGPSNATVRRALLNFADKTLDFDLELPLLRINATYNLKGNVLLLPLVGNGDVKMALKDVKSNVATKFSIKKLPEEVIQIDEMKVQFLVGGMKIHLDNLFNGNQILGASLNLFLNQNANEIIAELRSDLENGLAKIFINLWNNVFSRMPIKLWLI